MYNNDIVEYAKNDTLIIIPPHNEVVEGYFGSDVGHLYG